MNKKIVILTILCIVAFSGCAEKDYKETEITAQNCFTIFKQENNLTDEEKEYINLATATYIFEPSGMCGKTVNDIIEEGKIIKINKDIEANKPLNKLKTINNEFVTELWNEVFCDISHYIVRGTNSTGGELDIEYTIRKADNLMQKRDEYNNYIENLSDNEFAEIKYVWSKLINEIDTLYAKLKNKTPSANDSTYEFSIDNLDTYSDDFGKELKKING